MQVTLDLLEGFFNQTLIESGSRVVPVATQTRIRLNRNESAFEIPKVLKKQILDGVLADDWKNYPPPYYNNIEELIGKYCGVEGTQIVTAAGSANLIASLLNYAGINLKQVVIARPSFSLYEFHCNTYGISYETWWLNEQLEYDISDMPKLKPYSLVLFASPNNPVGNIINKEDLMYLLNNNPLTFFVVDEVYHEFSEEDLTSLVSQFSNLILLRSFSKSFSGAGLRIGYLIAQAKIAKLVRKLILPFSLNYLAMAFAGKVLSDEEFIQQNKENIRNTILEKQRVEKELIHADSSSVKYSIKPSYGNFVLIVFKSREYHERVLHLLSEAGIELLDLTHTPMLRNALRMTIGRKEENDAVLGVFKKLN
jgi:histidinol-phosphate aminotransferase